jgi:hypothetical protein
MPQLDPNMQALLGAALTQLDSGDGGYVQDDLLKACKIPAKLMIGRWSFFKRIVEIELTSEADRIHAKKRKMLVSVSDLFIDHLRGRHERLGQLHPDTDPVRFISHGGKGKATAGAFFADFVTAAMREEFLKAKNRQLMGHAYARDRLIEAARERGVALPGGKKAAAAIEAAIGTPVMTPTTLLSTP